MARQLDIALIVDLEATCWREGSPPPGQYQEIIEIGIATIDLESLQPIDKHSLLVTPTESTISEFCTELTTLTPQMVERRGVPLEEACRWLRRELQSPKRLWMSWGDFDRRHVERECARKSIRYPFGPSHMNAKTLFALAQGLTRECGMTEALDRLGFSLEGTHHRGVDDAWNTARIVSHLLQRARV